MTHANAYRHSPHARPPDCRFGLLYAGKIFLADIRRTASLWHCPSCRTLTACTDPGVVAWETELPAAAQVSDEAAAAACAASLAAESRSRAANSESPA